MKDPVRELEKRLGLRFREPALARQALTHKSWVNEHKDEGRGDNERLEFLGDAILDLAVSERLMQAFPDAPEGTLSKLRASLVDEVSLSRIAEGLDLGAFLFLGRGEDVTGGRAKPSLLADALEAIVAAVYLERGLGPTRKVVDRLFEASFLELEAGVVDRDFKTQLQEQAQKRQLGLPRYRVVEAKGPDHRKVFVVEVQVGDRAFLGEGHSKKDAERLAAASALTGLES